MSAGVIYYNVGQACLVRLLVSIYSLKQHYNGPITIISEGVESDTICTKIATATGVDLQHSTFNTDGNKNHPFLAKTKINEVAPYDHNVFIDSDTVILGKIDELFNDSPFTITRMAEWSTNGNKISGRIRNWSKICPDFIQPALDYGKAINTGIFAFKKDASIFKEWYDLTLKNRNTFIPDEVSCQILLPRHQHIVLDCRFNYSCKHGPNIDDIRIIHYHGKKHCRIGLPYNADKWMKVYSEVVLQNIADIKTWQPAGDRVLRKYLEAQTSSA